MQTVLFDVPCPPTSRLGAEPDRGCGHHDAWTVRVRADLVLLNSEPHHDHAGGLAAIQQASGAELWASEASAGVIAGGGDDPDILLPLRPLFWIGAVGYPPARVDHRFKDGDTIRVVSACSPKVMAGMRYPEQGDGLEHSFRVLRSLPADIWVTSHARFWARYRKFVASASANNPVDPFIDPKGYRI